MREVCATPPCLHSITDSTTDSFHVAAVSPLRDAESPRCEGPSPTAALVRSRCLRELCRRGGSRVHNAVRRAKDTRDARATGL